MALFTGRKVEVDALAEVKKAATDVFGWFNDAIDSLEGVADDASGVAADSAAQAEYHLGRQTEAEQVVSETKQVASNIRSLLGRPQT